MEHLAHIPTGDGNIIYGRHREIAGAPLVVQVHGSGGFMGARLETNFARLLEKNGIASFRYNQYGWEEDARNLGEMGLAEHVNDLSIAIDWASERSNQVIVIGHSFGAMTAMLRGSVGLVGAVFWDMANQKTWVSNLLPTTFHAPQLQQHWMLDSSGQAFSERIFDEVSSSDPDAATKFDIPLLVISAAEYDNLIAAGRDCALAAPQSEWVQIEGADHNFSDDKSEEELFRLTLEWIKRLV